ncbi:DUF305 domain-containing protein [Arthrobacter sp. D1-29]
MNKKLLTLSAASFAVALTLAGCAADSGSTPMPGMSHGSSGMSHGNSAPAASADHNAADVKFAQMMIPHHAQAVEMSDMILDKTEIPASVTALATKIKEAQGPEIDTMTGWLKSWNEPTEMAAGHSMSGSGMSGMMDEAAMKELQAAQGTDAARLFLTQMTAHHEGAVTMAKAETSEGKNPEAVDLSKKIVTAQEAEIKEMQELLATL